MTTSRQSPRMLRTDLLLDHRQNVRDAVGDVTELAASIRQHGLIQPIVVTEHPNHDGKYLILAGHRRVAAARAIPLKQVPCLIRHGAGTVDDHLALMLVENMQRSSLSAIEKARAMRKLIDRGLSQSEVARRIGVTPASVNTYVMLLDLSDDELEQIEAGEIRLTDARAAVKATRAQSRVDHGTPGRGRPRVTEPRHFGPKHPLAATVAHACQHSARPKVGSIGCGQCWEQTIRDHALGAINPLPAESAPTPARDVDEVAIRRRLNGDTSVALNIAERELAVEQLNAEGRSDHEIADRLGVTQRTVHRVRQRLSIPAAPEHAQQRAGLA